MYLTRTEDRKKDPATGALYINGAIDFALLAGPPATTEVEVYTVHFEAGARNRVHVHKNDQVLIATEGRGIIADANGERFMDPGDVVTIPAGHPHWHGATATQAFTHITVARPGDEIEIVDEDPRGAWGTLPGKDC